MAREARQASTTGPLARIPGDATVLVVGPADTGHALSCRTLATHPQVSTPLRVCAHDTPGGRCNGDGAPYESGAGNYESLAIDEAGLVVTESMANLTAATEPPSGFHVCVDGVPSSADPGDQRTVFSFLHAITRWVADRDTGCHVHLDADPGSAFVDTVAPLFDSVLELRDGPEGRLGAWDEEPAPWTTLTERPGD